VLVFWLVQYGSLFHTKFALCFFCLKLQFQIPIVVIFQQLNCKFGSKHSKFAFGFQHSPLLHRVKTLANFSQTFLKAWDLLFINSVQCFIFLLIFDYQILYKIALSQVIINGLIQGALPCLYLRRKSRNDCYYQYYPQKKFQDTSHQRVWYSRHQY
jgi:hypothetical protein